MAHIHGIAGSTRYLLNGVRPVNGKQLATLNEIKAFYENYEVILSGIEAEVGNRQNQLVADLQAQETELDRQIAEGIEQETVKVYRNILKINDKIESSQSIVLRGIYTLQFWGENYLSSYRINKPFHNDKIQLEQLRYHKQRTIANKQNVIVREQEVVRRNHRFLKEHESFLIGAHAEEEVVDVLKKLPDSYHVLNDVNLHFDRSIYWRQNNEHIRNCQIDHIIVGPAGLILLETKNWKKRNLEFRSNRLIHQVKRAEYALWYHLKNYYWRNEMPKIRAVVVSMQGFSENQKTDPYIDGMTPDRLCSFIMELDQQFSESDILKLIKLIPCHEVY